MDPIYAAITPFPLKSCLFDTINVTPNTDISKYKYSGGYGFAFQRNKSFFAPK